MRDRAELERLAAAAGFRDTEAAVDTLEAVGARLPPALLEQAIASPEPDRALLHFRELVARGSSALLALLRDEPQLGRMLATLFGTSDRLADLLLGHPACGTRSSVAWAPRRTRARCACGWIRPPSRRGDGRRPACRRLRGRSAARRAPFPGRGAAAHRPPRRRRHPGRAGGRRRLTDLAEVCLEAGIAATLPALTARLGAPRTGLTVLGLGSLGAREMRYGSDLDLVFLYGEDGESTAGVDHREWFARASQRFIFAMETMLEEGRLYKVDARLRPSGEQGLLVTSWTSFERYHRDEAADWERVALMRARIVFSNEEPAVRAQRDATLQRITFDSQLQRGRFVADLRRVRGRVTTERGSVPPGSRHLKLDAGGLMDVELLVALGQLENAADPALRTTVTARALARLAALGWPAALADDYAGLRRVALRLRLLRDRPEDIVSPRDLPVLARSLGTTPTPWPPSSTSAWPASARPSTNDSADASPDSPASGRVDRHIPALRAGSGSSRPAQGGGRALLGFGLGGDAVQPQLLPQVLARDAQDLGRLHLLAVGLGERAQQVFVLELLQRRRRASAGCRPASCVVPSSVPVIPAGRCSTSISPPPASTTACSTACANSRTLPGNAVLRQHRPGARRDGRASLAGAA